MLCFAYGSNMSSARLRKRVPSARFVAVAMLSGYRLRFHKIAGDGSSKCDAEATSNPDDQVYGVVFELAEHDKPILDQYEGLGHGYDEKEVAVQTLDGRTEHTRIYVATRIDRTMKPYHWYKEHVLIGAREHSLPGDYIGAIEQVISVADPSPIRCARERAVHR